WGSSLMDSLSALGEWGRDDLSHGLYLRQMRTWSLIPDRHKHTSGLVRELPVGTIKSARMNSLPREQQRTAPTVLVRRRAGGSPRAARPAGWPAAAIRRARR